jgi:iron(III) transport system ATP-binding protein
MEQPLIRSKAASVAFENVTKAYGAVVAVNSISFDIPAGELVTLLGPSGCGKTTTLRMIAGLERATSGHILIGGRDITSLPATERDVSMVFQSYALFPHMTVLENVSYGLVMSRLPKKEVRERAEAGLALVGLSGYGPRLPSELSGGQQQRVAVARALVLEPEVLLFDEPLSNLDAKLRRHVREEIRDIQQSLGLTVVYVTHDQEEALAVSDKIIVMNNAVIAQTGTPRQLYDLPESAFVADFIGEANLIPCRIEGISADGAARVRVGGMAATFPSRGLPPGDALLAVRPRRVRLGQPGGGSIPGTVRKATYAGNHMEYLIETKFGELFAVSEATTADIAAGTEVGVSFAEHGPVLLPREGRIG